ncbi:MAG: folate-binding protein [Corynebacterium sp.]|uniref:CAF17-like 4Fe-4S cluster assembly/insertion protein YgfZ n=1 Tax=Corynebacterium sp. TaxID=1720 RepID=UPI0026DB3A72|nr:folate-binding protein [Corynebacterium sp.]MDO4761068.1 folate-binding protein [Corynebacterium sp.]
MMVSPLLSLPGAAEFSADEQCPQLYKNVAWHYGNPLVEQRYLAEKAFVDRSNRTVIAIRGDDRETFLNNLLSQKLLDAPTATQALNLDGQGRVLHQMDVFAYDQCLFLDTVGGMDLLEYLQTMIFWSQVEVELSNYRILSVFGGYEGEFPHRLARGWVDVFIPADRLLEESMRLMEAGYRPVGLMAFEAVRVQSCQPEATLDFDHKSIPHEAPVLIGQAVHLNKGCYRGQETVARVENLGRSPRILVRVHIDGSAPTQPQPGDAISSGGRTVGRMGTVVHDLDFGPIGLALVKRSALNSTLAVGDVALSVDPDSIPSENTEQAGKKAIEKLRGLNP